MSVSIKIDDSLKDRIRNLADARKRSSSWVMKEAIEEYVSREEARDSFYKEGMASLAHYRETGLHLTWDEVSAWLKTWGTDAKTELPKCHK